MVRKTFYVRDRLIPELKEIAVKESTNQTQVYNEFIEFALFCYQLTKQQNLKLNEMCEIYKKGVLEYVDNKGRDNNDSNNSSGIDLPIFDLFD